MDKENVVYVYTMEYYSAIKKEILPCVITGIDFEYIKQSEMSQRKTDTIWFHLYAESKK